VNLSNKEISITPLNFCISNVNHVLKIKKGNFDAFWIRKIPFLVCHGLREADLISVSAV